MHGFTDGKGRVWELAIDVAAVKRVRALLEIDLYEVATGPGAQALAALITDPCKLVDVLFALCRDQAQRQNVSDEDFGRGFAGDSLQAAAESFLEELIDFFPDRKGRENLRLLIAKGKAVGERLRQRAEKELTALDPDQVDLDSVAAILRSGSGVSPASSASTPTPSPCAS